MPITVTHDEPPTKLNNNTPPSSETPPEIPPTNQPTDSPIDNSRYISTLEETLREQNRHIQELTTKLSSTPEPVHREPEKTTEERRQEFFNDPVEANRRLIREELQSTVAPLVEFVNQLKGGTKTDELVNRFKNDVRFSGMWDNDVEAFVRNQVKNVSADQLNDNVFGTVVVSAIGMKATGILPKANGNGFADPSSRNTPAPAPNPNPTPMPTTPPHMRPSAPPGPSGNPEGKKKARELTELERRLARERRMTDAEYLEWLEVPATDVVNSAIGKETK